MSMDAKKLRSIYDAIDIGSYKLAVQTCNKLLKKSPNSGLIKALKSLALLRSTKLDEAISLCDEVLATKPTDEDTLLILTQVLRHLERHEDIITLFDDAFKKQPTNEELGTQAFMAMIRIGGWKAAQQVSLKMSKTFRDPRLLYWCIMCTVLQAEDPTTPAATKPILLSLALRLLSNATIPSLSTPDKFHLHLSILLGHEPPQLDEARRLLETEQGTRLREVSLTVEELRRTVWNKLGLWEEERELCMKGLQNGDRNWIVFLSFIESTFALISPRDDKEGPETTLALTSPPSQLLGKTRDFLASISQKDGAGERGGHLALLEIEKRARARNIALATSLLVLLQDYFNIFGDKSCCFEDLKPYLDLLAAEESDVWLQFLQTVPISVESIHELRRTINVQKFSRYVKPVPGDADTESSNATLFLSLYFQALPLGNDLPDTELQPADDLILLAGNALVSGWLISNDYALLLQAICILEYALQRSKHNYQFHLLLVRLYHLMGAPNLAMEHYRAMDIKQTQCDTLSHFVLARASTFSTANNGDLSLIAECLEATHIYQSNTLETPEMLTKAFQFEKYSQIREFIEFEDLLDNSLQRDLIKIEHLRMRFVLEPPTQDTLPMELQELDFVFYKNDHHDNRDYSVLPEYQSKSSSLDSQTSLGPRPSLNYFNVFTKLYMRAMSKATDPDFHSPNLTAFTEAERAELTEHERSFVLFSHTLSSWLSPQEKPPNQDTPAEDTPPAVNEHDIPVVIGTAEAAIKFFDDSLASIKRAIEDTTSLPWEALHIASLAQEALVLLGIQAMPFLTTTGKKKVDSQLVQAIKSVRAKATSTLLDIATELIQYGEQEGAPDRRRALAKECEVIQSSNGLDHDFVYGIVKKLTDSRRATFSNFGKGINKQSKGARVVEA